MLAQENTKYWENVANFIFIPVSTFLDSPCGSSHRPAKAHASTTLCSSSKKPLPGSGWSTLCAARAGTSDARKAPHFLFVCVWLCCRGHLWGAVLGEAICGEGTPGAPNHFRSIESY